MRDAVIVGSGAGGGALALALSQAGWNVLVLEKGRHYELTDFAHDEVLMADRQGFFVPRVDEDPHMLVTSDEPEAKPRRSSVGWIASCVGGGTAHMGGYLYRFHEDDFRLRSKLGNFEECVDWPYPYQELEPYYSRAEWEIGVSGRAGSNPFEGPRSRPYPMAPVDSHPLAPELERACDHLGLNSFPTPRSVNSRPYQGRPACSYCESCAGYGCPTGARGSSQASLLSRALATGHCEIRSQTMVRKIRIDRHGKASGCVYFDAKGAEREVRARIVCVCCSAVESARLLLMSQSSLFPDGLANGNGLVGRHLQFHSISSARGRFRYDRHPDKPLHDDHPFLARSVMDHYFLPTGISDFPKGGVLRFGMSSRSPIGVAKELAASNGGPAIWGERLKRRLREHYRESREVYFEVFHDYVPNAGTYVRLDPEIEDKWGLPVARIHLDPCEHHRLAGQWLVDRGLEVLDAMGADESTTGEVGYTTSSLVHGTCRAGHDPADSVLDGFCQAHEVPNLFVVDGSFMPTSGGAAPTLTILANSFRTADHMIERARAGDFV